MSNTPSQKQSAAILRASYLTVGENDDHDYCSGMETGLQGAPEPRRVNWATWQGWRDGAAVRGALPLSWPFALEGG